MRLLPIVPIATALAGCSACGRTENPTAPVDALADANAQETSALEAASEVSPEDGRLDDVAAPLDASGGYGPFVGDWRPLPGVSRCLELVAVKPSESVPVLKWADCASGRPGCKMATTDWETRGSHRISVTRVARIGGKLTFGYVRRYLEDANPTGGAVKYGVHVIERSEDEVLVALGTDYTKTAAVGPCGTPFEFGDLGVSLGPVSQYQKDRLAVMSFASWTAPTVFTTRFLGFDELLAGGVGAMGSYYAVSGGAVFMTVWSPNGIAVYEPISGEIRTKAKSSLIASRPAAVTGGVIAMHGTPGGLDFIGDDGAMSAIVRPTAGRWDVAHGIDRARGDAILWAETDVDTYAKPDLWETPLAKTLSEAAPRRIGALPVAPDTLVANAGAVVMTSPDSSRAFLVRLSDGARWTLTPEPGDQFGQPLWVDDNEVWMSVSFASAPARGWTHSILRLSRSSLGSPSLP